MSDHAKLAKLREPFAPEQIGKMPRKTQSGGTIHLDYVGHANCTARLLNVDPEWTWEPVAYDESGLPALIWLDGKPVGLWIRLTVCGITRIGYGSCVPGKSDAVKELIGDAIRNAAMRFGVALDLWSKEELEQDEAEPAPKSRGRGESKPASNVRGGTAGAPSPRPTAPIPQAEGTGPEPAVGEPAGSAPPATGAQKRDLWGLAKLKTRDESEARALLAQVYRDECGKSRTDDLTFSDAGKVIEMLAGMADYVEAPEPAESSP